MSCRAWRPARPSCASLWPISNGRTWEPQYRLKCRRALRFMTASCARPCQDITGQVHRICPARTPRLTRFRVPRLAGRPAATHAEHESIEITQGLNDWSELGFYFFTSEQSGLGAQWVGDHIRPRVRVPESWHWPFGASLSTEIGYQRAKFSPDTWTWEIR